MGAHTLKWNSKSVGIAFMGDYQSKIAQNLFLFKLCHFFQIYLKVQHLRPSSWKLVRIWSNAALILGRLMDNTSYWVLGVWGPLIVLERCSSEKSKAGEVSPEILELVFRGKLMVILGNDRWWEYKRCKFEINALFFYWCFPLVFGANADMTGGCIKGFKIKSKNSFSDKYASEQ